MSCALVLFSCVKPMDEPCLLPIAGKWAKVEADGSISNYIEFKAGMYYEYAASGKYYYSDGRVCFVHSKAFELSYYAYYSVIDDQLYYGEKVANISISDGILKLGDTEFYPLQLQYYD